jgi:hypothetical protein
MGPIILHHFPKYYVLLASMSYKLHFCVELVTDTNHSGTRIRLVTLYIASVLE